MQTAQCAYGNKFTVSVCENVAGKDVAKKMRFEVIIFGRAKFVIERLTGEFGLNFSALCESVVIRRHRRRFCALIDVSALSDNLLQCSQRVERARKTRVGIELRKCLFDLICREFGVETLVDGVQ